MKKFVATLSFLGLAFSGVSSTSALGMGNEAARVVVDVNVNDNTANASEGFMFIGRDDKQVKNEDENKQKDEKKEERKELSLPRRMLRYARKAAQAGVAAVGLIFANERLDLACKFEELLEDKCGLDCTTAYGVANVGYVGVCGMLMAAAAAI